MSAAQDRVTFEEVGQRPQNAPRGDHANIGDLGFGDSLEDFHQEYM